MTQKDPHNDIDYVTSQQSNKLGKRGRTPTSSVQMMANKLTQILSITPQWYWSSYLSQNILPYHILVHRPLQFTASKNTKSKDDSTGN